MKNIESYIDHYEFPSEEFPYGRLMDNIGDDLGSEATAQPINDLLYAFYACIQEWKAGGLSNQDESSINSDFREALRQKFVNTDVDQVIAGVKTFGEIPLLPARVPVENNHAASKEYVDQSIEAVEPLNKQVTVTGSAVTARTPSQGVNVAAGVTAGTRTLQDLLQELTNKSHDHTSAATGYCSNCNCNCNCACC